MRVLFPESAAKADPRKLIRTEGGGFPLGDDSSLRGFYSGPYGGAEDRRAEGKEGWNAA